MKKSLLILLGIVLGIGVLWRLLHVPPAKPVPGGASRSVQSGNATAAPVPPGSTGREPSNVPLKPEVTPQAPPTAPAQISPAASRAMWPMPNLTRPLPQLPGIQIGDREWIILGTNDVVNDTGKQTVLVLRDEVSGQLAYRQSSLRFVLKDGENYESFIAERSRAKRLFVNILHGDIAVDAANVGAEYTALSRDPRVVKVDFIPLVVPARLK
jgi:hypothetical protein